MERPAGSPDAPPAGLPRVRSLDRALLVLAVLSIVMAIVLISLLPLGEPMGILLVLFPVVYLVYVAAGVVAWYRRPSNRLGPLIVLCGLSIYLVGVGNSTVPALELIGDLAGTLPLAAAIHLLHAFPSGRLRGRLSTSTVILAYAGVVLLQPIEVVTAVAGVPGAPEALEAAQIIVGVVVMASTVVVLVLRLRTAEPSHRAILIPVYSYGVVAIVLLRSAAALVDLGVIGPEFRGILQLLLLAGIPVSFVFGVLAGGFAKTGEIDELGTWLNSDGSRGSLRAALARALGDPSLDLAFWLDDRGIYVDADGRPARGPAAAAPRSGGATPRAHVEIERDGHPLARIEYDPRTVSETWLVQSAGNVVALALAGEKLTAELRASRNDLRESRERLVHTAERERRRIARDLHDGLQMRLVILALDAQRLANTPGLPAEARAAGIRHRRSIDDAAAELRLLVTQVDPPGLVEGGLPGGLDDLIDRLPLRVALDVDAASARLPAELQRAAYYVVSEALTNVVKHAGATSASVRIEVDDRMLRLEVSDDGHGLASAARREGSPGTGLRGLRDRLDVVGGTLDVTSSEKGTTVFAEIPCAS
jgi:signal transduction histidine kinase